MAELVWSSGQPLKFCEQIRVAAGLRDGAGGEHVLFQRVRAGQEQLVRAAGVGEDGHAVAAGRAATGDGDEADAVLGEHREDVPLGQGAGQRPLRPDHRGDDDEFAEVEVA